MKEAIKKKYTKLGGKVDNMSREQICKLYEQCKRDPPTTTANPSMAESQYERFNSFNDSRGAMSEIEHELELGDDPNEQPGNTLDDNTLMQIESICEAEPAYGGNWGGPSQRSMYAPSMSSYYPADGFYSSPSDGQPRTYVLVHSTAPGQTEACFNCSCGTTTPLSQVISSVTQHLHRNNHQ